MLRIRLQRSGRKKRPNYRIVVAEHSAPVQGRYVEALGTFDPLVDKHGLVVDEAKVQEWIKKGAKPTNTVARLLKGKGEAGMDPFIVEMKDRAVKNPKEAPEAPATESAPAETPVKASAEEAPVTEEIKEQKAEEKPPENKEESVSAEESEEKTQEEKSGAEGADQDAVADLPAEEEKPAD